MARNIYALLVGIDAYEDPVPPLRGCKNDINYIINLLEERATNGEILHLLKLEDTEATRAAIIKGFTDHLSQAGKDDAALFYYSGHGSQEQAPPEFWVLEPDRLNETLVCYDSRRRGSWDLSDKEQRKLIADVASSGAHVTVILDCCHSGSGTRSADALNTRRAPADTRQRPLDTFLPGTMEIRRSGEDAELQVKLPSEGRHILLAACRSDEEAKEFVVGGKRRGVFSHFLTETLAQAPGSLTYRDLFKRVNALVRSNVALQTPRLEPTDEALRDEQFLGGDAGRPGRNFTLSRDNNQGWVVDAGAVHGIVSQSGVDAASFAIFPQASTAADWTSMSNALGTARVKAMGPHLSTVEVDFRGDAPDPEEVYKAVLTSMPLPPLEVLFEGEYDGLNFARTALSIAGDTGTESLLVREPEPGTDSAQLRLVAVPANNHEEEHYSFYRVGEERELVAPIKGFTAESAAMAVQRLEHIARWMRIAELSNPASGLDGKVALEIYNVAADGTASSEPLKGTSLHLRYKKVGDKWKEPKFKAAVVNKSEQPLHCALLALSETFAVVTGLIHGGTVLLQPNERAWATLQAGDEIPTNVPDEMWKEGVLEVQDILKLIASTGDFDASLLEQKDLDHAPKRTRSAVTGISKMSTLGRLMKRVQTRAIGSQSDNDSVIDDWITKEFTITTLRPRQDSEVPRLTPADLASGVKLMGHPTLVAKVRLTSAPLASRDTVGDHGLVLPPLLRDNPAESEPFTFSASRGGDPGLSVLELFDVSNPDSVTPDNPLRLKINQKLMPGEMVLPLTHDGEFFFPVGKAVSIDDVVEVAISALPAPQNTRSLSGAVRIYFQKIVSKAFGTEYNYPILAAQVVDAAGQISLERDQATIHRIVDVADRVLLYIHGIIGDSERMAESVDGLPDSAAHALRGRYDLVLTFDYENLNTSIKENGRLLGERLERVGLGPEHGKTLDIVAHSMGGLVSRWFIEREGGNKVVHRLAMLGTPNGGSPWSSIEDWSVTALTMGLNGLANSFWPAGVLGWLVKAVESIDVALDEMNPESDFLKELAASDDPVVPYSIIAGNVDLIYAGAAPQKVDLLKRLLNRLIKKKLIHLATAPAFFGKPNDIAVSVVRIHDQPTGRSPAAVSVEVACDHLTYFSTEAGLAALEQLLPSD